MKWSKSFLFTLKNAPSDAEIPSHILLIRAGFIRKVAPGIFTYGPMMLRALKKFENIVREELDAKGCQELLMPMVQPKELWQETNRWEQMGDGLQKMKNRSGHDFCLGATHEEVVTDFVRKDVKSYRDLGFILYQIQAKFRDEIRPRFGLMRGREFIMKDGYSFDTTPQKAMESYHLLKDAYQKIFERLGLEFRIVTADAGNIGGDHSQEFHVLAQSGEDQLFVGDDDFAANAEVCPAIDSTPQAVQGPELSIEEFATPNLRTISDLSKFLKLPEHSLVKTLFFSASNDPKNLKPIAILLRGSDELNPIKIKNLLGLSEPPNMLNDQEVKAACGASPGSCGPVGLTIPVYADQSLKGLTNIIVGANKDNFHLKNVNTPRDYSVQKYVDLRMTKDGDKNPQGEGVLKSIRGIEVGHIFYLGTKYSKAMGAQFLDIDSQLKPIEMGCYGIGISRTVQAAVEQSHDKDGIIWPPSIAPFHVHIALLDPQDSSASTLSDSIVQGLQKHKIDVFVDDRDERPGVKFKDADLLGFPVRINIGSRGLQNNKIEIITRKTKTVDSVSPEEVVQKVLSLLPLVQI